jgi:hypothetical protein
MADEILGLAISAQIATPVSGGGRLRPRQEHVQAWGSHGQHGWRERRFAWLSGHGFQALKQFPSRAGSTKNQSI